jgi:nucleotide-binding universal stress UspA family protein
MTWHQDLIVAGVDGTDRDADVLALASHLASLGRCRTVAAHAHPFQELAGLLGEDRHARLLRELSEGVRDRIGAHMPDTPVELRLVADPSPAKALQRLAAEEGAQMLVVGASRRNRIDLLGAGSVTERAVQGSPCPVAVASPGYGAEDHHRFAKIGCAFDGGAPAEVAMEEAAHLARLSGGELRLIAVFQPIAFGSLPVSMEPKEQQTANSALRALMENRLSEAVEALGHPAAEGVLLDGDVVERLTEQSAELDLLVVGSRGYGPFRSTLIGGVSGSVIRMARCPVLVCLRDAARATQGPEDAQVA